MNSVKYVARRERKVSLPAITLPGSNHSGDLIASEDKKSEYIRLNIAFVIKAWMKTFYDFYDFSELTSMINCFVDDHPSKAPGGTPDFAILLIKETLAGLEKRILSFQRRTVSIPYLFSSILCLSSLFFLSLSVDVAIFATF